ncbi:efflux RND transporter periplasmic adaptor subunit [Granulosicoccus sp. 3-233]|uniref:efflux RND transporter periplasmic adaptor subunit n=1 Tax=Granulosicoccus sp. 3-233 TaxID=3417969 RepID=UPI003D3357F1
MAGGLIMLVGSGAYWWQAGESVRVVDTLTVERGRIDSQLQLTGKVINDRTVTLTALLDGEIMAIRAREGDVVKAGTVLAELDSRQARALLDKARAEVVLQQQAVDAATRNFERTSRLFGVGDASEQAQDDSLDKKLAAEASLQAAQATLTLNQLRFDNALIRSPFDGTVIQQSAETGQWLEAGQPLFTVVATEGIVIEAPVSASDWPKLSIGQSVELSLEASAEASWHSEVSWIAPTVVENESEGQVVAVRFPPGDDAPDLLLGQEVDVDLSLKHLEDALVVPFQVLSELPSGAFTAFVLEEGKAALRHIEPGLSNLNEVAVVSGLAEGEQIIIPDGGIIEDGQTVRLAQ